MFTADKVMLKQRLCVPNNHLDTINRTGLFLHANNRTM